MMRQDLHKRPTVRLARRKDGGGVEVRVTWRRRMRRYGLGEDMACRAEQWRDSAQRYTEKMPGYVAKNVLLGRLLATVAGIVDDLMLKDQGFTWERFDAMYSRGGQPVDVVAYMREAAARMEASDRVGNARSWRGVARAVAKHNRGRLLTFEQVTPRWLENWEHALRAGGANNGGISNYMRCMRAAVNAAIRDGLITREAYPFATPRGHGYDMKMLRGSKAPRPLPDDELRRLKRFPMKKYPHLADSVRLVLLMYYGRGMNFADIARLRKVDVQGTRATYQRQKTKRRTTKVLGMAIKGEVAALLRHYANTPGPWALPILGAEHRTEKAILNRIDKVRKKVNADLREVAKVLKLRTPITTYTMRHTYGSVLLRRGVDLKRISEGLGHSTLAMTEHYVASLGDDALDATDDLL